MWDEPSTIRKEWRKKLNYISVDKYYSQIWVYGSSLIYDVVDEYGLSPNISNKIRYTGYLCKQKKNNDVTLNETIFNPVLDTIFKNKFVLCLINDPSVDMKLATEFMDSSLPKDVFGIVYINCNLNKKTFSNLLYLANKHDHVYLLDYGLYEEILVNNSIGVISSCSYSIICNLLSYEKNALIIPKISESKEQVIRGSRLNEHGIFDLIHYDDLNQSKINCWINNHIKKRTKRKSDEIEKHGLRIIDALITSILTKTKMTLNHNNNNNKDIPSSRMQ